MRVLVTGGAGYIGSHAALRLLEDGHSVSVVESLERGHARTIEILKDVAGDRLEFLRADLADTDALTDLLTRNEHDLAMHFAALTYVGESVERPLDYFRTNTAGGISLLTAMKCAGVRRLIFSSTCATYGEPSPEFVPIGEETPQNPINPYGRSKLQFEEVLRAEVANPKDPTPLAVVALRYFNVAGCDAGGRIGEDHRPESHLIPICLEVALGKREHLTIFGEDYPTADGTCIRDYVHVEDLISAHLAAVDALEPGRFKRWNVGIGRGSSVREVLESCRRVTGHAIPAVRGMRRPGDPPRLYADPSAIARDLGWSANWTDLDAIVATAWRWMQANPRGYG